MQDTLLYQPFWMVWHADGNPPIYRHTTESSAVTECERLARLHPGKTFVVLRAVEARRVDSMLRIKLTEDALIPF